MIPAITDHLWQSTIFVLAAALVAATLRKNGAHVRHAIWLIASLKFLLPFSVLMTIGTRLPRLAPAATLTIPESVPDYSIAVDQITQPFTSGAFVSATAATEATSSWIPWLIAALWLGGFAAVVGMRARDWSRVRAALRASVPIPVSAPVPVRSSPGLLEPGVVGFRRPVLLVPEGIESRLTPPQLQAVLLHEICHVQRRDNLTSAIHMLVEAVFWFHPLVWFIGARLVDERERACDEYVLRTFGDRSAYAESILNVCRLYVESPIACVSGVTGSDLKKRIGAILHNRVGSQLTSAGKLALAIAAALTMALPVAAGALTAPLRAVIVTEVQAGAGGPAPQRFDVASIKPCESSGPDLGGRRAAAGPQASPGYLYLSCLTLRQLVLQAHAGPDSRLLNRKWEEQFVEGFPPFVTGGPSWAYSDRYTIEAKAEGATTRQALLGPPLRALLEERFKLKFHRVTEERTMLTMTVAKSGLKIHPTAPGSCFERDPANPPAVGAMGDIAPCGLGSGNGWGSSEFFGVTFGDAGRDGERFTDHLWRFLRRPVADRTGLTGRYSFKLEFTPDDTTVGVSGRCGGNPDCMATMARNGSDDARPASFKSSDNIFKALEKLGLKLEETKAPFEHIVIDHAEKPGPDFPEPPRSNGAARTGQPAARFDVVSVKPCPKDPPPSGPAAPAGFRRGGAPWSASVSPGYAFWSCATLAQLVDQAYADAEHPLLNIITNPRQDLGRNQPKRVRGGPSWVETEKFTIEAKVPLELTKAGLAGAGSRVLPTLPPGMAEALRVVLEDRFKVRVRRATEEQPMWALTISKDGLNKELVKEPVKGDCLNTADYSAALAAGTVNPVDPELRLCGRYHVSLDKGMRFSSFAFAALARELSGMMDQYVLDKTGVDTPFNFTIKTDPADGSSREVLFSRALERMGLKLEPTKGPAEYLLIERAERPTPNSPSPLR